MRCLSGCGPVRPGKIAHGPDHGPHPQPAARWWPGPVGPWPDVACPVPARSGPIGLRAVPARSVVHLYPWGVGLLLITDCRPWSLAYCSASTMAMARHHAPSARDVPRRCSVSLSPPRPQPVTWWTWTPAVSSVDYSSSSTTRSHAFRGKSYRLHVHNKIPVISWPDEPI